MTLGTIGSWRAMTAAALLVSAGLAGCASTQPRQEVYPSGKLKAAYGALVENGQELPQGQYKQYYESGEPMAQGRMERGVRTGAWTEWYPSGAVSRRGSYVNGQPSGQWNLYTEEGRVFAADFDNGVRTGAWILQNEDGTWSEVAIDDTGLGENVLTELVRAGGLLKVEVVREQHENGALKAEYEATRGADGQPIANGKYVSYYANGNKQAEGVMRDGQREGFWTLWYESGKLRQEGTYVNSKLEGSAKLHREDGSYFDAVFQAAKPQGTWTMYSADGRRIAIANYADGVLAGEQTTFYPDGNTVAEKIVVVDGKRNGPFESFWPNGNRRAMGDYRNDLMEGVIQTFHENGNRAVLVRFVEGKETGRTFEFSPDGTAKRSTYHMNPAVPRDPSFVDEELLTLVFGEDRSKWPKPPLSPEGPGQDAPAADPAGGPDVPGPQPEAAPK